MLKEDFDKCPVTLIADDVLDRLEMHVTSLGYLEDGLFQFVKLPDGGTKEENRQLIGLNKQPLFLDNKQELGLDDLDVEQIRKKKTKAERQRTRQKNLANTSIVAIIVGAS